jgi:hypothetical protein
MMQFYIKFLRESLHVKDDQITIYINCYLGNGLTQFEIENYWLEVLSLKQENLRKTIVNNKPQSSQQKGRKLPYGVCNILVHSTLLVNHIFGAIQEYAGIEKPEWLM